MKTSFKQKAVLVALFLTCILCMCTTAFAAETESSVEEQTEIGPGIEPAPEVEEVTTEEIIQGDSIGIFHTTAYCPCSRCSSSSRTFAGTTPVANHTISADLSLLPLGTRVMINGNVYTVEDKGSGIRGNELDIFFNSHAEALQYGRRNVEVFSIR